MDSRTIYERYQRKYYQDTTKPRLKAARRLPPDMKELLAQEIKEGLVWPKHPEARARQEQWWSLMLDPVDTFWQAELLIRRLAYKRLIPRDLAIRLTDTLRNMREANLIRIDRSYVRVPQPAAEGSISGMFIPSSESTPKCSDCSRRLTEEELEAQQEKCNKCKRIDSIWKSRS